MNDDQRPLCETIDPMLWAFVQKVGRGAVTHEELADAFAAHLDPARIGSRDIALARLRAKCPTQADLTAFLRSSMGRYIVQQMFTAMGLMPRKTND